MMGMLLAASLSLQPAGWLEPDASDFHIQVITKAEGEQDWPFVATSGKLACVQHWDDKLVMFIPDGRPDLDRGFLLHMNLFAMWTNNIGLKDVLVAYKTPEELIRKIAPFVAMGHMLCKQNKGPIIPGGEL
jgi:hypothetical protein